MTRLEHAVLVVLSAVVVLGAIAFGVLRLYTRS